MRITTQRTRYVVPSVTPFVESVTLDDFDLDEIRAYLRHRGEAVSADCDGLFIDQADLDRAETMAMCGQIQPARDYILDLVSRRIGRRL